MSAGRKTTRVGRFHVFFQGNESGLTIFLERQSVVGPVSGDRRVVDVVADLPVLVEKLPSG
jgi:hypothetical protein